MKLKILISTFLFALWSFTASTQTVVCSVNGGIYAEPVSVSLTSSDPEGTIYYTTDGSKPDETDKLYTSPLTIDSTVILKSVTVSTEGIHSSVTTNSYLFTGRHHTIPILSLSADPEDLFGDSTGIYVVGKNGITGYCNNQIKRNFCRDWERAAFFEYFAPDGSFLYKANAGLKIHGNCSRNFPQKSFALYARKKYGDKNFKYPFFTSKTIGKFEAFILRNSGNDNGHSMMRDGLMSRLMEDDSGVDYQAYEPVTVYLNGAYWGLYNMREKLNEHYTAENHGTDSDNIDMLENLDEVKHGDTINITQLIGLVKSSDLNDSLNWQNLEQQMDVDEFIRYMVAEIYSGNTDWPVNNVRYWRERSSDGRWRWILYDTDFGFAFRPGGEGNNLFTKLQSIYDDPDINTSNTVLLFMKLMKIRTFREQFTDRLFYELNTRFSASHVQSVITATAASIADEMQWHAGRWNMDYATWENDINRMNYFAEKRADFVTQQYREFMADYQLFELALKNDSLHPLALYINGKPFSGNTFEGLYEMGSEMELTIDSALVDTFDHWEINGVYYSNVMTLKLKVTRNMIIQPALKAIRTITLHPGTENVCLYPNPTYDQLYILAPERVVSVTLTKLNGRQVQVFDLSQTNTINLDNLDTGMYLAHIKLFSGKTTTRIFLKN
ncbi:CotH kinase family protein [Saccharicrinis sp. FJH2]|uniref:CotH kinase family protein n=1 Tax=Saccharicrinis sp. FJH65 TaxID=3344659 RepID=UPI0035F2DB6B